MGDRWKPDQVTWYKSIIDELQPGRCVDSITAAVSHNTEEKTLC